MKPAEDRRKRRTRRALIDAFNALVLDGRRTIRVVDIVERADVGRSTFYEHYAGVDDLHMRALAAPLGILADAVTGHDGPDSPALQRLLEHFWEHRQRARETFDGAKRQQMLRLLTSMLEERLAGSMPEPTIPLHLIAVQLAAASLALISAWLYGETTCSSAALAHSIRASASGALAASRQA